MSSNETGGGESLPPISEAEFQALAEMIGADMPEVLIDLLDTYIEESSGLVNTMTAALGQEQSESMMRAAHSLKSSSASIGAMRLSDLCAALEAHLRNTGAPVDVPVQVRKIAEEFERVREALEQHKEQLLST
jgi:HPt (histidine-containing phosphotransfer) domain-containing protein